MSDNLQNTFGLQTAYSGRKDVDSAQYRETELTEPADLKSSKPTDKPDSFFRGKYIADRLFGGVLLILTAPLTLVLFALVKLTSPGPGFYRQQRVGLGGKLFYVIKLRSMVVNAERDGEAVWCVENDARITGMGQILRRLHLDELPQLFNVVMGDMCLVGPRPERPEICERLARQIDCYYDRNAVKPGITGLAQINLPPDETIEDVRRKQILDLDYIDRASVWLDTRVLILTGLYMIGIKGEALIDMLGLSRQDLLCEQGDDPSYDSEDQFSISYSDPEFVCSENAISTGEPADSTSVRRPR